MIRHVAPLSGRWSGLFIVLVLTLASGCSRRPTWPEILREASAQRWGVVEGQLADWLQRHPGDVEAEFLNGLAQIHLGREQAGARILDGVPERFPGWGQAQHLLGEAALKRHDAPEAERRFRAAARSEANALAPRQRLIYLCSLQQRTAEVRERLWEIYGLTQDPRTLIDVVLALFAWENDVRGMPPELDAFLKVTPSDPFLNRARGLALLLDGRSAEALPCLQIAADGLSNDPVGRLALAECLMLLDRFDGDLDLLGPMPSRPIDASRWWVYRGRLQEALGRDADAVTSLKKAVETTPDDYEGQYRLGQILSRLGQSEEARTHLARAAAIDQQLRAVRREHDQLRRVGFEPSTALFERLGQVCRDAGLSAEARAWFQQAIRLDPLGTRAQSELARTPETPFPLFLAAPVPSENPGLRGHASPAATPSPPPSMVRFEDVTARSGIRFEYHSGAVKGGPLRLADTMGGGVGLIDYDGDGWLDLYFVNGCDLPYDQAHPPTPNRLYRNRGDGTFEDVTERAGVAGKGYGMGCAVGDYDNDGRDDLFVTGVGRTVLYHNRGDGTFEEVTERAGVGSVLWTTAAGFGDLDRDGDLDLVVVTYVEEDLDEVRLCKDHAGKPIHCSPKVYPAQPDLLFRNNGDGTFTEIAEQAGFVGPEGRGLGLAIADLDDDGWLDVYVANDASADFLFLNRKDPSLAFEEVGQTAGVAYDGTGRATASMGVVADDLDGDGRIDLFHTNFLNEPNTLHRNLGNGLFVDATLAAGLSAPSHGKTGFGTAAFDADNDGRLDLFVANGHVDDQPWVQSPMAQAPLLFLARSQGRFDLAGPEVSAYLGQRFVGRGVVSGDLDNDGRIDLVVVHRDGRPMLLKNNTAGGHWLEVRLRGRKSGSTPIGARLIARVGPRSIVRWLTSGTSYLSASDPRIAIGLGPATRLDSLELHWPSGVVQVMNDVSADQILDLTEPASSPAP